jgi:hypothetical protein
MLHELVENTPADGAIKRVLVGDVSVRYARGSFSLLRVEFEAPLFKLL